MAGLGYGDEGKGAVVDYLARHEDVQLVIRYNGGSQAAHNVVTPDGRHHTFSQFGSGTFNPGVRTHLSLFMVVDPLAMVNEEAHLRQVGVTDAFARTTVSADAWVTTPYHKMANRMKEMVRSFNDERHGSTGQGIGEVVEDFIVDRTVLMVKDLLDKDTLYQKLEEFRKTKIETVRAIVPGDKWLVPDVDYLVDAYSEAIKKIQVVQDGQFLIEASKLVTGSIAFEGAQGMLIDSSYGFPPYYTWTDCTFVTAQRLVQVFQGVQVERLGIVRAYATRHGPGPLVTEDMTLAELLPDPYNGYGQWQGRFRVGHFDVVATKYALRAIGGVDRILMTNLDRLTQLPEVKVCTTYVDKESGEERFLRVPIKPVEPEEMVKVTQMLERCEPRAVQKFRPYISEFRERYLHFLNWVFSTDAPVEDFSRKIVKDRSDATLQTR